MPQLSDDHENPLLMMLLTGIVSGVAALLVERMREATATRLYTCPKCKREQVARRQPQCLHCCRPMEG